MPRRRERIAPAAHPQPPFAYSPAVRFGPWVFGSMQMATDYAQGILPECRLPYRSSDTAPQGRAIMRRLSELLDAAGSSLQLQVRQDTYFARRRHFGTRDLRREFDLNGAPTSMALHANRMLV